MINEDEFIKKISTAVVKAGSTFRQDKKDAYSCAINNEENEKAKWVMRMLLDNAEIAEKNSSPLCDDTGIPHILIELGKEYSFNGRVLENIEKGISEGLVALPGRPMAILGDDYQRIEQSQGIDLRPEAVRPAPTVIKYIEGNIMRVHVLLLGGGPAIRGRTYRIFHKHSTQVVIDNIVEWGKEAVSLLGCSPCSLAVGIGRSNFEASSLMLQAIVDSNYNVQSDLEKEITEKINRSNIGPMGLHGKTSVLATFLKVGEQRASGVRIVSMRPCCCIEPRIASVEFS